MLFVAAIPLFAMRTLRITRLPPRSETYFVSASALDEDVELAEASAMACVCCSSPRCVARAIATRRVESARRTAARAEVPLRTSPKTTRRKKKQKCVIRRQSFRALFKNRARARASRVSLAPHRRRFTLHARANRSYSFTTSLSTALRRPISLRARTPPARVPPPRALLPYPPYRLFDNDSPTRSHRPRASPFAIATARRARTNTHMYFSTIESIPPRRHRAPSSSA